MNPDLSDSFSFPKHKEFFNDMYYDDENDKGAYNSKK